MQFLVQAKKCRILTLFLFACVFIFLGRAKSQKISWQRLQKGLYLADKGSVLDSAGKSLQIVILKACIKEYDLKLLSASQTKSKQRFNLKEWVNRHGLLAAINASMFWKDQLTSTGYMKNFGHVNNKLIHPDYGAFLCFNPINSFLPGVTILDRKNQRDWKEKMQLYQTVVQGYRMVGINGKNAWEEGKEKYSVAALGLDKKKNLLFIFNEQPRTIYRLNNLLLELPLELKACMFAEGGLTAGMYIKAKDFEKGWHGVPENGFWGKGPGRFFMIPNVIGIVPKKNLLKNHPNIQVD